MSSSIDQAFVKQYGANIFHTSQQKGSRLRPFVRQESQKGEVEFFERLGPTTALRKVARHSDTPLVNSEHTRRAVYLNDYEWADLIDKQDMIRTLIDPQNPYVQSASMALGRSMDDEIIAAALGSAYSGKEGSTAIPLPASQFVGATDNTNKTDLNVITLIRVKEKFGVNDVDESIPLHIACTQKQISSLLNENKVTSADYAAIKALVYGEVDTFMGFKFHRIQRLPTAGAGGFVASITEATGEVALSTGDGNNCRRCFAWAQDGIVLSTGMDIKAKIDERADKSYSTQVYASMSVGAVRLEEYKVVGILCTET